MNIFHQTKYNNSSSLTPRGVRQQMVHILSTVIEDLKTVKQIREENKFTEVASRVLRIDRALENLEQKFNTSENKEQAEKVMEVYSQIRFGLKLVALRNGKAEEYDNYINYLTNIKQATEKTLADLDSSPQSLSSNQKLASEQEPATEKESSPSSEKEVEEPKNFFNIKGHLELSA